MLMNNTFANDQSIRGLQAVHSVMRALRMDDMSDEEPLSHLRATAAAPLLRAMIRQARGYIADIDAVFGPPTTVQVNPHHPSWVRAELRRQRVAFVCREAQSALADAAEVVEQARSAAASAQTFECDAVAALVQDALGEMLTCIGALADDDAR